MNEQPTPKDLFLERQLLPQHMLVKAESWYPGELSVLSSTRYTAELEVCGFRCVFYFPEGSDTFSCQDRDRVLFGNETLKRLATHRAAEAIRAVRQGHREYVESKRKKKLAASVT